MSEPAPVPAPETPPTADPPSGEDAAEGRRLAARLITYRLVPLWMFLFVFGITLAWEAATHGNAISSEKFQAAALISLVIALFVGAPVGIRFFNPLPPKK